MLLPTLSRAKEKGKGIVCLSNMKQLTTAWVMYADDYNDRLVWNDLTPTGSGWVRGILDYNGGNPDNTNTIFLTDPQYAKLALRLWNKAFPPDKAPNVTVRSSGPFGVTAVGG